MAATADKTPDSIYDFKPTNIDGKVTSLSKFKGNVLLIVNTASKCGYTPQYEGLQSLYETYKDQGFVVLGFPANNFGGQEPGTDEQIKQFCKVNYEVNFPMFSKVSVKGGEIEWNFEKFLIGKDGKLIRRFRSAKKPQSNDIKRAIEKTLNS